MMPVVYRMSGLPTSAFHGRELEAGLVAMNKGEQVSQLSVLNYVYYLSMEWPNGGGVHCTPVGTF